jgi:ABC-type multidrug transport system fused ATPase/permease subunit
MLQGIRVTKLNHYESKVMDRVEVVRNKEMRLLRWELVMWAWTMVAAVCSPLLATAAAFSFYVLVNEDNLITPSKAFTVLLLFSVLRFPINMGARLVGKLAQALDSAKRISEFLQREAIQPNAIVEWKLEDAAGKALVDIVGATFLTSGQSLVGESEGSRKDATNTTFAVSDVTLSVHKAQVCAIVGRVGSGKSVLLQGLLGETRHLMEGHVSVIGNSVGYAAQVPFILNTTLMGNILFGLPLDKQHYRRVLAACCLEQDILRFPGGDLCQIGERGVTLSGGEFHRLEQD